MNVQMDRAAHNALADRVLGSLADTPPVAVRLLAAALNLADGPVRQFSTPIDCFADRLEFLSVTGRLATLTMARALRVVARDPGCEALLDRLEGADAPPWPQIHDALAELRASRPDLIHERTEG